MTAVSARKGNSVVGRHLKASANGSVKITAAVKLKKKGLLALTSNVSTLDEKPEHIEGATVVSLNPAADKAPLSDQDRHDLVIKYRLKARKLSRSILRKWHARLDQNEVDSVVDLSLCEAVRRYNPAKGASFMTFMYFHLRGNLIRAVTGAVQDSAIPAFEDEEVTGYAAEVSDTSTGQAQARAPRIADVVTALYGDDQPTPEEDLYKRQIVQVMATAKGKLDGLEREVIERLYFHEHQLLDIADSLGYSRCHISRVKKRALHVLGDELSKVLPYLQRQELEVDEEIEQEGSASRRPIRRRRPRSKKSGEYGGAMSRLATA